MTAIELKCYICSSEGDLYVICADCLASHKEVEATHGSRAAHSAPVHSSGYFPADIALTARPSNKEIARVIRILLRYADGHELRGQWAQELREVQKVAQQSIAALEASAPAQREQETSKDTQINRLRYAILGYFEVFDRCGGSESVSPETFAAARQGLREALAVSSTDRKCKSCSGTGYINKDEGIHCPDCWTPQLSSPQEKTP